MIWRVHDISRMLKNTGNRPCGPWNWSSRPERSIHGKFYSTRRGDVGRASDLLSKSCGFVSLPGKRRQKTLGRFLTPTVWIKKVAPPLKLFAIYVKNRSLTAWIYGMSLNAGTARSASVGCKMHWLPFQQMLTWCVLVVPQKQWPFGMKMSLCLSVCLCHCTAHSRSEWQPQSYFVLRLRMWIVHAHTMNCLLSGQQCLLHMLLKRACVFLGWRWGV